MTNRAEETEREWRPYMVYRSPFASRALWIRSLGDEPPFKRAIEAETYLPAASVQEVVDELERRIKMHRRIRRAIQDRREPGLEGQQVGFLNAYEETISLLRERCLGGEEG